MGIRWPAGMIAAAFVFLGGDLFAAEPSYYRDVRPVLERQCQGCHQPNLKSSDLDLTTYEGFAKGGKHGPATGFIVKYVTGELKPQMPLGQPPLPAEQIELLRGWVAAGAKDDTPAEARESVSLDKPVVYLLPPVVTALAFSPDGKTLAVSGNREVLLHSLDGSAPPKRLPGLSERILSLEFSKDGSALLAGGGTPARFGELQLWDVAAGKLRWSRTLTGDTIFGASLSPDGTGWRWGARTTRCALWTRPAAKSFRRWALTKTGCWGRSSAWTASASSRWGATARRN